MYLCQVLFKVEFTPEELASLRTAAEHHYDGVCKMMGRNLTPTMTLCWRDFDILAKICESPLAPEPISQTIWKTFAEMRKTTETLRKESE